MHLQLSYYSRVIMKIVHACQGSINNRLSDGQRLEKIGPTFSCSTLALVEFRIISSKTKQTFLGFFDFKCVSRVCFQQSQKFSFNLIIKRFFFYQQSTALTSHHLVQHHVNQYVSSSPPYSTTAVNNNWRGSASEALVHFSKE